jgi:cap3/cap4 methyltransferase
MPPRGPYSFLKPAKRPRSCDRRGAGTSDSSGAVGTDAVVVPAGAPLPLFFPRECCFPTALDDRFPAMPYQSRRGELKTSTHWGQRKLLLSELQLLTAAFSEQTKESGCSTAGEDSNQICFHVVYAGAAPGSHLALLDDWFGGRVRWTLVDPMPCDSMLRTRKNFTLVEDYFTDETALSLVGRRFIEARVPAIGSVYASAFSTTADVVDDDSRGVGVVEENELNAARDRLEFREHGVRAVKATTRCDVVPMGLALLANAALLRASALSPPLLFICDIRSGGLTRQSNPSKGADADDVDEELLFESAAVFEKHVEADMNAQMRWVDLMLPFMSLLKFRLPYMELLHPTTRQVTSRHEQETTNYLSGRVLLPIWTRPTSTEGRLLVRTPLSRYEYNNRRYEDQFFFFNRVLRERVHFSDPEDSTTTTTRRSRESFLDHRYDGSAEVHALREYLSLPIVINDDLHRNVSGSMVDRIVSRSAAITDALGKSFAEARSRLPRVMMQKAIAKGFEATQRALEKAGEEFREMAVWWGPALVPPPPVAAGDEIRGSVVDPWLTLRSQDPTMSFRV